MSAPQRRGPWSTRARWLLIASVLAAALPAWAGSAPENASVDPPPDPPRDRDPRFFDPQDGWLDLSGFLDTAAGFMPLVQPITEPAVGYGATVAGMWLQRPDPGAGRFARPDITVVGGLYTESGTWGVTVADLRSWRQGRLRTRVMLFDSKANLEHYGIGDVPALQDVPLDYEWDLFGGVVGAEYRVHPDRQLWVGLEYRAVQSRVALDAPFEWPEALRPDAGDLLNAALTPSVTWDTRDSLFTPSSGTFAELSSSFYGEWLGGDRRFEEVDLTLFHFLPVRERWTLGLRADAMASFGDMPFYLRPWIGIRGVTAQRYQGDYVAQLEGELRWNFWQRFSMLAFAGTGTAWKGRGRGASQTVYAGGVGLRYEIARRYKLHVGFDVAFGPDNPILYIQVGSAWNRP